MKESLLVYKDKKGKEYVCIGFYDESLKEYIFKFTEEELVSLFRSLVIKVKKKKVK